MNEEPPNIIIIFFPSGLSSGASSFASSFIFSSSSLISSGS